jgi:hypothetical protein
MYGTIKYDTNTLMRFLYHSHCILQVDGTPLHNHCILLYMIKGDVVVAFCLYINISNKQ